MPIPDTTIFPLEEIKIDITVSSRMGKTYSCYFILQAGELKGHTIGEIGDSVQATVYSALKHACDQACKLPA